MPLWNVVPLVDLWSFRDNRSALKCFRETSKSNWWSLYTDNQIHNQLRKIILFKRIKWENGKQEKFWGSSSTLWSWPEDGGKMHQDSTKNCVWWDKFPLFISVADGNPLVARPSSIIRQKEQKSVIRLFKCSWTNCCSDVCCMTSFTLAPNLLTNS